MNTYEITFIVRPDLDDDSIDATVERVMARVATGDGEVIATLPWNPARRRMAYPIRDYGDGVYITVHFRADAQSIREMENALKLDDRLLRFLIVQASELSVKQAQQRVQQRIAAAAAPPPIPAPVGVVPGSADAPPAEAGAVPEVLAAQTQADIAPVPSADASHPSESVAVPVVSAPGEAESETQAFAESIVAPTAAPREHTEE
ncbi:MAG: hypothetical protein NVS4B2_09290 [Chloroflexota bacterium]